MIRTVCVCVCPLPALLKIEPGCTDCHTYADMLLLELYLWVGGSQIPYTSHTFPSSAGRKGPAWVPQGMSPGEIKANKVWGKISLLEAPRDHPSLGLGMDGVGRRKVPQLLSREKLGHDLHRPAPPAPAALVSLVMKQGGLKGQN